MSDLTDFLLARVAEDEKAADLDEQIGHVSRQGYARALADCEAKRRIVAEHTCGCSEANCADCGACSGDHHADPTPAPCLTLRFLAAVYADHPDFRPEWRP